MMRVVVLYEQAPDAAAYADHVEVCRRVPGGVFRHGRVVGAPVGEPRHAYMAEWEFPDRDAFETAARSPEFQASGKDAFERGFPTPTVEFVELD